jgi:G3E family GTPase
VVLLSKTELAAPAEVEAARAAVATLAPRAPVMEGDVEQRAAWPRSDSAVLMRLVASERALLNT